MVDHKLTDLLVRALSGDPKAMADIASADHPSLLEAQRSVGHPLVLNRTATVAVLRGLLDRRFPPADVQSWASLVRRGYVADREAGPIEPLEIEFEDAWEDAISEAVSRLDEIGDVIDGEVTSGEVLDLLQLLGESRIA